MIEVVQSNEAAAANLPPSEQWIDIPVGQGVSDSPGITMYLTHPTVDSYNWDDAFNHPRPADAAQYLKDQSGVFAGSSAKLDFWRSFVGTDGNTRWSQGTVRPGGTPSKTGTSQSFNASQVFAITTYLTTGITSRGRVGIDSDLKAILSVPPWFTDPADKSTMIDALNSIVANIQSVPDLVLIQPDNQTSVEQYVNNYRNDLLNTNHWVGSNKMGASPSMAVVDENAKVFNTDNLFIVDASIIPSLPVGNPQGTIMSAAEQAAVKILALTGAP